MYTIIMHFIHNITLLEINKNVDMYCIREIQEKSR